MKIKHWQGYGTVNATKVYKRKLTDGSTELKILVSGNHEWGLYRDDKYDVNNWLIKRFDRTADLDPYRDIISLDIYDNYDYVNHEDKAMYTIRYKKDGALDW